MIIFLKWLDVPVLLHSCSSWLSVYSLFCCQRRGEETPHPFILSWGKLGPNVRTQIPLRAPEPSHHHHHHYSLHYHHHHYHHGDQQIYRSMVKWKAQHSTSRHKVTGVLPDYCLPCFLFSHFSPNPKQFRRTRWGGNRAVSATNVCLHFGYSLYSFVNSFLSFRNTPIIFSSVCLLHTDKCSV